MTQTSRPITEIQGGHSESGGTDKAVILSDQSDSSFISGTSVTDTICKLANLSDPGGNTNYIFSIRAERSSGTGIGGHDLCQGDPAAGGTVIASWSTVLNAGPLTTNNTLLAAEADAITDFANLYYRYQKSSGTASVAVYDVWFSIPDASPPAQVLTVVTGVQAGGH